jgi:hypothetical protein
MLNEFKRTHLQKQLISTPEGHVANMIANRRYEYRVRARNARIRAMRAITKTPLFSPSI